VICVSDQILSRKLSGVHVLQAKGMADKGMFSPINLGNYIILIGRIEPIQSFFDIIVNKKSHQIGGFNVIIKVLVYPKVMFFVENLFFDIFRFIQTINA
jgi:hypothetical protein